MLSSEAVLSLAKQGQKAHSYSKHATLATSFSFKKGICWQQNYFLRKTLNEKMTNAVMNTHTTPGAINHDYSNRAPTGIDRAKILKFGKSKVLSKE